MLDDSIFNPTDDDATNSHDDFAPELDSEKKENTIANQALVNRRNDLSPEIQTIRETLLKAFGGHLNPQNAATSFTVLYDWVYSKIEFALDRSVEEAEQWIKVANDLISLDEYALLESEFDLMHGGYDEDESIAENAYNQILKAAGNNYVKQAKLFMSIGFALLSIIEDEVGEDSDLAEDYLMIKEDLDRKYGPLFAGLENQFKSAITIDRSYGRVRSR